MLLAGSQTADLPFDDRGAALRSLRDLEGTGNAGAPFLLEDADARGHFNFRKQTVCGELLWGVRVVRYDNIILLSSRVFFFLITSR